jgi:hypothetical protein
MPPKRKRKMTRAEFMRMKQRFESTSGRAKKKRGKGKSVGGSGADKSLFQQTGEGRRTDLGQSFRPSIVFNPYINVSDIGNSYNKQYGRFQPFSTRPFRPPPPPPNPPAPQPVINTGQRLGGSNIFEKMPYSTTGTQTNILNTKEVGSNTLPTLNPIYRPPSGSGPTRQMMDLSRTKVGSSSLSGELAVRNPNLFNLGGIPRVGAGGNRPLEVDVITGNNDGLLNPQVLDTQAQIQQSKEMGSSPDEEEKEEINDLQESKEGESVDKVIQTQDGDERQETIGKLNLTRHAPLEQGHTREAIEEIRDAGLTPRSFVRQISDDLGTPPSPSESLVEGMTPPSGFRNFFDNETKSLELMNRFQPVSRPSTAQNMAIDPSRQQLGEPIIERQETFSDTPIPRRPTTPLPIQRSPRRRSQRFAGTRLASITEVPATETKNRLRARIAELEQRRDLQDRPLVINPVPPATATTRQMPTATATQVFEDDLPVGKAVPISKEDKGIGDNPVMGRPKGRPPRPPLTDRSVDVVSRDIQQGSRREFLAGGSIPTAEEMPISDIRRYNLVRPAQAVPAVRYTSVDADGNIVFSPEGGEEIAGMRFEEE